MSNALKLCGQDETLAKNLLANRVKTDKSAGSSTQVALGQRAGGKQESACAIAKTLGIIMKGKHVQYYDDLRE